MVINRITMKGVEPMSRTREVIQEEKIVESTHPRDEAVVEWALLEVFGYRVRTVDAMDGMVRVEMKDIPSKA
jgi:hypothetical protein